MILANDFVFVRHLFTRLKFHTLVNVETLQVARNSCNRRQDEQFSISTLKHSLAVIFCRFFQKSTTDDLALSSARHFVQGDYALWKIEEMHMFPFNEEVYQKYTNGLILKQ